MSLLRGSSLLASDRGVVEPLELGQLRDGYASVFGLPLAGVNVPRNGQALELRQAPQVGDRIEALEAIIT